MPPHPITKELMELTRYKHDGSYSTQANRRPMLHMIGDQLYETLGYKQLHAAELRGRHINKLLALWRSQEIADATMRNRLAMLRWILRKVGNPGAMAKENAAYGLAPRETRARVSKAKDLPTEILSRIPDTYVRFSLELQEKFGLRREEAIKLRVWQADQGSTLALQASWTKGGRARAVPIRTAAQREVLDRLKTFVTTKDAALIPPDLQYVQQLRRYEYWTRRVGLHKLHGLRHAYIQARYLDLTGFPCPVCGGPTHAAMTPAQQAIDADVLPFLSAELGHERVEVTALYLGY
jgi:hypothetical protein